jgi:uncharacterized protein (DUF885 family)
MKTNRRELLLSVPGLVCGLAAARSANASTIEAADSEANVQLTRAATRLFAEYPENATRLGIDKGQSSALRSALADRSYDAVTGLRDWASQAISDLRALDLQKLSPQNQLDVSVLIEALDISIAGLNFPTGDMALLSGEHSYRSSPYTVTQKSGAFVDTPDFLESGHEISDQADIEAYLDRLTAYVRQLDDETDRLQRERAAGVIPPDFVLDLTLKQMIAARQAPLSEWGLVSSFRTKAQKAGLDERGSDRVVSLLGSSVTAAMDRQIAVLKAMRTFATPDAGIWKRPDGEQYYAWALRAATTTSISAEDMHALGREQVVEIQSQMDLLLKAQGLTSGTVGERMTAIATRPDELFSNDEAGRQALISYLNATIGRVRMAIPRAFRTLVKGQLIIERVPTSIQDGAALGYGVQGSLDGRIPGKYRINLRDTKIWPRFSLPTLCFHEGIPGHVWQGEYANRLSLLRNYLAFNAYSEGWALYAEQLGDELGLYQDDPWGKLGYLQSIAFRASRLVVDTGIHAKRWSLAESSDWLVGATGSPKSKIESELIRYCAIPAQACGYKVGHNMMNKLRDGATSRLGVKFDQRTFNDVLVTSGNMPLHILETVVNRYISNSIDN